MIRGKTYTTLQAMNNIKTEWNEELGATVLAENTDFHAVGTPIVDVYSNLLTYLRLSISPVKNLFVRYSSHIYDE